MAVATASVTATGTLVASRCRVLAVSVRAAGTAGTVVLKDGTGSGTTRMTINTPAAVGFHTIPIPGGGLVFNTDCHATLTTADGAMVVYETVG